MPLPVRAGALSVDGLPAETAATMGETAPDRYCSRKEAAVCACSVS